MVHIRLNERESNPNPHINFISALQYGDSTENESARQFLRALAAQVRPLMKAHGFSVNSFEEYEHNSVFAGRNWNAGETIELVLRRADGTFLPTFWLMSTLCHELAHIQHMNHGHAFQALWKQLNAEVQSLQSQGYYGDGYWSSGTRLSDSSRVAGEGIVAGDLPEYVCGGAQTRTRPKGLQQRRVRKPRNTTIIASTKSGRQTAKPRKAGVRVKSTSTFTGGGMTLVERDGEGKIQGTGTGFGKQASSKRAREERALAIEKRLRVSEASISKLEMPPNSQDIPERDSLEDDEAIDETDYDRKQWLLSSEQDKNLLGLRAESLWDSIEHDFNPNKHNKAETPSKADRFASKPTTSTNTNEVSSDMPSKGKRKRSEDESPRLGVTAANKPPKRSSTTGPSKSNLVQAEIDFRKKEALGMAPIKGGGRTLGSRVKGPRDTPGIRENLTTYIIPTQLQWSCPACTFLNKADHLACSICATPHLEET